MGDKTKVIEVRHLQKSFGANEVLKDINFDVSEGEVVCVIGSSGSGKSTLLRCINLLEIASSVKTDDNDQAYVVTDDGVIIAIFVFEK